MIFMQEQYNSEAFRVSMRDIDLNGHVHNSVYLDYCEDAVVNAFRRADILPLFRPHTAGVAYHVKKCEATFFYPLSVDDVVLPQVLIEKIGNSSLIFTIRLMLEDNTTLSAEGKLVWVCVDLSDNRPCLIPDEARQALMQHLPFAGD
ncbi:acyl-CoA thioesterase [Erwinia persicina]|uniref:Acyl-CoA thioesterase n=2 Tax=Erwinia persicina TaxID=55211 RepID=A0ABR8ZR41_9GAMM|nr:thioesterase family protein [Erwinia persicina]MBD8105925.1 acyl-CoA thioesterase [Erwinia persicina]MBD8208932.1 acyl-CoA thioesterase [Erwinia persicina]